MTIGSEDDATGPDPAGSDVEQAEIEKPGRLRQLGLPVLAAAGTVGALQIARSHFQNHRLFEPERALPPPSSSQEGALAPRDVWIRPESGPRLHGWWIPHPKARATVLYCHGNRGNLEARLRFLTHLARLPTNLLAFDYRGYGLSDGKPSETGLFRDVRAAYQYLVDELLPRRSPVVLFGHSLGGAVAIDAAVDLQVAGLVVQASFTNIRGMARTMFPKLPLHWLARNQFRSLDKVQRISAPKLFIHGTKDETIPFAMGRELYEQAADPKEFLAVERGRHNDVHLRGGQVYLETVERFLETCIS